MRKVFIFLGILLFVDSAQAMKTTIILPDSKKRVEFPNSRMKETIKLPNASVLEGLFKKNGLGGFANNTQIIADLAEKKGNFYEINQVVELALAKEKREIFPHCSLAETPKKEKILGILLKDFLEKNKKD